MSRYALRAGAHPDRRSGGVGGGGRRPSGGLLGGGIGSGGGGNGSFVDAEVAALAALDAGLLPSSLSKEEMRRFATVGPSEYLEARSLVLSLWASDPTVELTSEACVAAAAADPSSLSSTEKVELELLREAHRYLSLIGAINFGLVKRKKEEEEKPPPPPPPADTPAAALPSDTDLLSALAAELAVADMSSTTEKLLRKKLEAKFGGVDLTEKKPLLRAGVERFLAGEAVVVVDGGGEEKEKEAAEKKKEAPAEETPPPLCRPGASAVVVGAGPAGLGAALHLSRCGVRVTVLEARARAGGRAHSVAARGEGAGAGGAGGGREKEKNNRLASAVDLGASIVTGVAPDFRGDASLSANATAGRRSDPSALLARQLGVGLHRLGESLPLFDPCSPLGSSSSSEEGGEGGRGRQVPKEADERADTMRDALLDDAKDAAFHSSSDAAAAAAAAGDNNEKKKRTLGEFLEASLAARLSAAAKKEQQQQEEEKPTGENGENGAADEGEAAAAARRERAAFASATATELRLLDWHWANLEYGCAAPLSRVCLSHWNQDDAFGGFGGGHAMVVGGYGALLERAAERLVASSSSSSSPSSDAAGGSSPPSPLVDLRLSTPVKSIRWGEEEGKGSGSDSEDGGGGGGEPRGRRKGVVVVTAAGEEVSADVAIVTVPLGVLKASVGGCDQGSEGGSGGSSGSSGSNDASISFDPPLPPWKADAVRALGFGKLEKVFLEFPPEGGGGAGGGGRGRFWPEGVDYFGVLQPTATTSAGATAAEKGDDKSSSSPSSSSLLLSRDPTAAELARGRAFMFWDVGRFQPGSPPVLAALFSGAAAERFLGGGGGGSSGGSGNGHCDDRDRAASADSAVQAALSSLRSAFGPGAVPDPVASLTTSWGSDPFAGRGAYSFVGPGASGATYDLLARPCSRRLLFAGEHTAREHPDTVGGAMLSGVREAARALGWGGVLGNAAFDGEEAMLKRRRKRRQSGGGGESGGESGSSSSSEDDSSSLSSSSDDDDDDDMNDEERNERRREAAEAALLARKKKKKKKKTEVDKPKKEKKKKRRQPRREAAARASSPDQFGGGGGGGFGGDYARTAEQAELDARAAAAERADARSLWGALALAASGSDPRARRAAEALSAADAAPHRRAVVLRCLTTADSASLAALARNPRAVKMLSGWTEEAARASAGASASFSTFSNSSNVSAAAVAADGARVLGSLPLPPAERGPSGAERAVRAVAAQCRDEAARAAAGAVLDSWFGKAAASAAARRKEQQPQQQFNGEDAAAEAAAAVAAVGGNEATALERKPAPLTAPVISDDALPPELRARLLEAERAAAEAAEHAAAAERIEAQLAAARRAAAASKAPAAAAAGAGATGAAVAVAAPVVADIGDFDAYLAARAKEEAKRRGLKRRKDAAAAALAAAEAEEEEEEAREKKEAKARDGEGDGEPAPKKRETVSAANPSSSSSDEAALLQEITTAVRACVSAALKRRLKQRKEKLSKEQIDGVARKAAAKIVEAEMRKHAEAAAASGNNPAPPSKFHLSESKEEKIYKLVEGYVKAAAAAGR